METGKFNRLTDIFYSEHKIIIPDLQRDYCWGTVNELARSFTSNLIESSTKEVKEFSLGLLYAYQYPEHYFYLCDGQQRITTLYLLLGVLNSFEKDEQIEGMLQIGFREPRLRYEVRNSTVYFLKELLNNVFLQSIPGKLDALKEQNWWRHEYNDDPSIVSMCAALKSIYALLKGDIKKQENLRQFIVERVGFVFFNLQVSKREGEQAVKQRNSQIREFGEKMYEIVNTRGVPMEPNEHLKPILLSQFKEDETQRFWTETWESWQDFFWQHKTIGIDSADNGFNEFLRWTEDMCEIQRTNINCIKDLKTYFDALHFLVRNQHTPIAHNGRQVTFHELGDRFDFSKMIAPPDAHKLNIDKKTKHILYTLIFYVKNQNAKPDLLELYRLARVLKYAVEYIDTHSINIDIRNPSSPQRIRETLEDCFRLGQVITTKEIDAKTAKRLLNEILDEFLFKQNLYSSCADEVLRQEVEDALWKAEDLPCLYGRIKSTIQWSKKRFGTTDFNLVNFIKVSSLVKTIFEVNGDLLRRAILLKGDYLEELDEGFTEKYGRGVKYRFPFNNDGWRTFMHDADRSEYFYQLLEELPFDLTKVELAALLNQKIAAYQMPQSDDEYWMYALIKNPELLSKCEHKVIFHSYTNKYVLVAKTGLNSILYDLEELMQSFNLN